MCSIVVNCCLIWNKFSYPFILSSLFGFCVLINAEADVTDIFVEENDQMICFIISFVFFPVLLSISIFICSSGSNV